MAQRAVVWTFWSSWDELLAHSWVIDNGGAATGGTVGGDSAGGPFGEWIKKGWRIVAVSATDKAHTIFTLEGPAGSSNLGPP